MLPAWVRPKLSLAFVGVSVFLFVIHSYRINVGQIAIAAGLVGLLFQGGKFRLPPGYGWCVFLFAWSAISVALSTEVTQTWEPFWDYGKVLLIGLVVANALQDASQVSGYLVIWLGCFAIWPVRGTLLNAALGIGEQGRYHWNFMFSNPNDLAGIVLLMLGLSLSACRAGSARIRLAGRIGAGVLALIVFLTQSRGGFLGLMVFGLVALAGQAGRRLRVLLGMGVVAAIVILLAPSSVWDRLGGLGRIRSEETIVEADEQGSAEQRYTIWRVAFRITADHPVTGVGLGSYPAVNRVYASRNRSQLGMAWGGRDTHSSYFNAMAELGIPGLIALLGFVIGFGRFLVLAGRRLAATPQRAEQFQFLTAAWVAFWVAGIFGTYHRIVFPYLFAGFAAALAAQYGVLGASAARIRAGRAAPAAVPLRPLQRSPSRS